jgi:hypothetical protein
MHYINSAKIFFFFAILLFVAKPFLGFSMFTSSTPPAAENIFIKAFTKRKQEFLEDSDFNVIAVQKRLAEPVTKFFLRFSFLLNILFPATVKTSIHATSRFLNDLRLSLSPSEHTYLVNSRLLI